MFHLLSFVSRWLSFSAESDNHPWVRSHSENSEWPCLSPSFLHPYFLSSFLLSLSSSCPPSFPPSLPFSLIWFLTEVLPATLFILKHPNLSHNQETSSSLLLPARSSDHLPQNHMGSLLKTQTPRPKQCKPNSSSKQSFQCLKGTILSSPRSIFTKADSSTIFWASSHTLVISLCP